MNGLTFVHPGWFWGLVLLGPLLVLRLRSHFRAARSLPGLVSPRLADRLVGGSGRGRRWAAFVLQCLAIACTITALARPQLGFDEEETEIEARNLLIAIDTSRSMLADDLQPSRLERAKLAAKDIVLSLPEDRIGLIAFAGRPFLQAPLTIDHEAILEAIDQLDTEIIPRGGTNLSAAANLALDTFAEAKLEQSALVLFSDGEALEGIEELERTRDRAAEAGMAILAVGVGSAEGSIIPEINEEGRARPGVFIKDEDGQVVRTRLEPRFLQTLASKGGTYLHLGGGASLTSVVEQIRAGIATSREERETRLRPIERFLWPLSAAVVFLVLSHLVPLLWPKRAPRRRVALGKRSLAHAVTLLTVAAMVPDTIQASPDLKISNEEYQESLGRYEQARSERTSRNERSYQHLRFGIDAYRFGDQEKAVEAFSAGIAEGTQKYQAMASYHLGLSLYQIGKAALPSGSGEEDADGMAAQPGGTSATREFWNSSIEHFESALETRNETLRKQAQANLEFVKRELEKLPPESPEEEPQEQDKEEKEEDEEKSEDEDEEEKEEGEDDSESGESPPQDPGEDSESSDDPGKESESGENPQDDQDGKNPDDSSESQEPGEEGKNEDSQPQAPPQPGEAPPQEPEQPRDGQLEANPNQAQPQSQGEAGSPPPASAVPHPETGYAPTEARQLLEALDDETEVRPLLQPHRGENFKNW